MKNLRLLTFLTIAFFTTINIVKAQTEEISRVKVAIAKIMKNPIVIYDKKNDLKGYPKKILILDDRIEFMIKKQKEVINFSDFFDADVSFRSTESTGKDGKKYIVSNEFDLRNYILYFKIDWDANSQMHHDLLFIAQQKERNLYDSQLISFEPIATQYRASRVKPPNSEEQRKYIIQANGFNDQKMYDKAIELYNKAIKVNQTAYPAAYSNLALLSAQTKRFNAAIYYMKKYLMLEPEATDARGAQDKIYLWEAQITK